LATMAEATLTMRPARCAFMMGATARQQSHPPLTFTAMRRSHSASSIFSKGVGARPAKSAALLTRTSMRPKRCIVSATMASTEETEATSVLTACTRPSCPSSRRAGAVSTMSAMTTRAPSARKRRA
jgi:hypothetical protein